MGVVAIVFAAMATGCVQSGDYAGAVQHSEKAKLFCWLAFWLGLAPLLLWLGYIAVIGSFAVASSM